MPTLHVVAGKIASGKTTLANRIAAMTGAVCFSEDLWLERLFPDETFTFEHYLDRSRRLRRALAPHIQALLDRGTSVVLDFAGNVPQERAWARSLCEGREAGLVLHYLNASDALCRQRLRNRNAAPPDGSQPTSDEEFDVITSWFVPPAATEGLDVREYDADAGTIDAAPSITVRTDLRPGDTGEVVRFHGTTYAREYGFDHTFEPYVAGPLAAFVRAGSPRERIWLAERDGTLVGCIAIVAHSPQVAQLRWFLVDQSCRGLGLGKRLVADAIAFSRAAGYDAIILWTVGGLLAAAHLYRAAGFRKVEEHPARLWGVDVVEERYELRLR